MRLIRYKTQPVNFLCFNNEEAGGEESLPQPQQQRISLIEVDLEDHWKFMTMTKRRMKIELPQGVQVPEGLHLQMRSQS